MEHTAAASLREERSATAVLLGRDSGVMPMLPASIYEGSAAQRDRRWGVVLAGGDGTRLRPLTRLICGDDRPKQFCPLIYGDTLLEHTRRRVERSIPWRQTLFPLTRSHRAYYLQEAGLRPSQRIVQPANKGTAPPIALCLLSIEQIDKEAIVAILPCDHHYSDERAFTAALESAFDLAREHVASVVLLGARPSAPEVEYGWIELGQSTGGAGRTAFHVRGFCEKPSFQVARELLERGSLWNTFVMVGHVRGFLKMMEAAPDGSLEMFGRTPLWVGKELQIQDSAYESIPSVNFSQAVLSAQARRLIALQLGCTDWSDLGRPERVLAVFEKAGVEPWWIKAWQAGSRMAEAKCA